MTVLHVAEGSHMNAISYDMNFRYCYSLEGKIDMSSPV